MRVQEACETRYCDWCHKVIKGKTVYHIPPTYEIQLGVDYVRTFHPACYEARKAGARLTD